MAEQEHMTGRDPELLIVQFLETGRQDLKDLIILQYAPMVERISRKFSGLDQVDDLIQVGYIGLLNALSKFDPAAGVRFNTYATHLVTGEIKHYLRDRSQTIRHPAWLQEMRHKVQKANAKLQSELSRPPTYREIAEAAGVGEDAVAEVFATQDMLRVGSLDVSPDDEDSESDVDRLEDFNAADQLGFEEKMILDSAISQLRELEQQVLVMFHFESLNQTEIAGRLGISCNYVSHILRQSLTKLRRILASEELRDTELHPIAPVDESSVDPATGVYTDKYFKKRLTEEIHRVCGTDGVVSVIIIDFSGLQTYRSFYGQESANELIADAGSMLKQTVRTLDIVCRYGQSGFGIILPATGDNVGQAATRLFRLSDQWLNTRTGGTGRMKVLLGYATAPTDSNSLNGVLEAAIPAGSESEKVAAA